MQQCGENATAGALHSELTCKQSTVSVSPTLMHLEQCRPTNLLKASYPKNAIVYKFALQIRSCSWRIQTKTINKSREHIRLLKNGLSSDKSMVQLLLQGASNCQAVIEIKR